ncbi:unnamed protein product [Closterium sp. NIES-65]|nr:unnamed protein product [Closterium sp. NIES-65]
MRGTGNNGASGAGKDKGSAGRASKAVGKGGSGSGAKIEKFQLEGAHSEMVVGELSGVLEQRPARPLAVAAAAHRALCGHEADFELLPQWMSQPCLPLPFAIFPSNLFLFQLSLFFRPHSNVRFPPVTFDRAFLLPSPVTPSFLRSVHEADANGAAAAGGAGDDWAVVWGKWPGGGTAQELADLHVALVEAHLVTVKRTFNRARVFVAPHARCSTTWSSCRPVP